MPRRRKKWERKHRPKFTKHYIFTLQDDPYIAKIKLLHKTYALIAKKVFGEIKSHNLGEWEIKINKIKLFIDPEFGAQAELEGTSKMPLLKRLTIHIGLLQFLKEGCSLLKAVKLCHLISRTL